jgi:hypothetical protein
MIYQIKVKGKLDESWSDWLGNVQITSAPAEDGTWVTTLVSAVPDPPALFGILDHIRDLNLTLILLREISGEETPS